MHFEEVTAFLDSLAGKYGVPCADCIITRGGRTVYRHLTGHSDYAGRRPASEDDLYRIYSCTKVITMAAAMQLVEQGRLSLDDRVAQYLPEFADMLVADSFTMQFPVRWPLRTDPCHRAQRDIRIRELMSMTAGLSYDITAPEITALAAQKPNASTREIVRAMAQMPLVYDPGTRWCYSLGHDVIAAVIEVITGERFSDYLQKRIFTPLNVHDFYFHLSPAEEKRLVAPYEGVPFTEEIRHAAPGNIYCLSSAYESGGAGLACTAQAYSAVIAALACGGIDENGARILTPESVARLGQNELNETELADFRMTGKIGYGYGLGVRTLTDPQASRSPVGEFGWDGAAGAYSLVDCRNQVGIVYFEQITGHMVSYREIHPTLRDLAYEALELG